MIPKKVPLPSDLTEREKYLVLLDHRRVTHSNVAAVIGVLMLVAAFAVGYTADTEKTCSTSHTETTTTQPASKAKAGAEAPLVESADEKQCSDVSWPRGPVALAGLGLLLIAPLMIRLLPPGSRFAIAGMELQAGPAVQAASAKKSSGSAKKDLAAKSARRASTVTDDAPAPDTGAGGTHAG